MTKTIIKAFLTVWLLGIVTIALLSAVTRCGHQPISVATGIDTVWLRDTIIDTFVIEKPIPKESILTGHIRVTAPVIADSASRLPSDTVESVDSALVDLPVITRHYAVDSIGEVWISGPLDPRLDSLRLFRPRYYQTAAVTAPSRPTPRWSVGLQAGYGITPRGLQPYIGIGVSVRLFK